MYVCVCVMYCPLHLSLFAGCRYWLTVFSRRDIPDPDEDIYDAVYQDDDEDIYDDLCALKNKRLNDREQVLPLEHWSSSFFFWQMAAPMKCQPFVSLVGWITSDCVLCVVLCYVVLCCGNVGCTWMSSILVVELQRFVALICIFSSQASLSIAMQYFLSPLKRHLFV